MFFKEKCVTLLYIPINDTPFELHVFWPSDTEYRIKLTFSESVSLSHKTRLMTLLMRTLLNMPQTTSNLHSHIIIFNSLTTEKQTTKFLSANFQKILNPSYIILRIQRLESKQCRF